MRGLRITRKHIGHIIYSMFPWSVLLRWEYSRIVTAHYFGRDNETFCFVADRWFKVEYHWISFVHNDEQDCTPVLDSVTEVDVPSEVIYSHSSEYVWDDSNSVSDYVGCEEDSLLFP